ncbi:hypothetical protein FIBSPDRAFT_1055543 [Athelia psychrophila]|uniref:Uncharacterized protein n=1 Tax=Athelia psychrophila TaxID=1759441 RepID=A0A167THH0_9AGAM|nr:hypothetical protein FIBSPDRAFT_1055543 [Fibularhizoctonia sp. CBS 109695]
MSSQKLVRMDILDTLQALVPRLPPSKYQLPVLEEAIIFSADSLLNGIAGIHVCDIGPRRSRQVVKKYFLQRVEDTLAAIHKACVAAGIRLRENLDHDPSHVEEATHQSYDLWFNAREMLAEASMSNEYFHCMLEDLEQSERNMDLMTLSVPTHAAPIPSHVSSEQLRKKTTIERTYHSKIPAILRALPDEASHTSANLLSSYDLADRLSQLKMADYPGQC